MGQGAAQHVGGRHEIGVEHADELTPRHRQPGGECPGLESVAVGTMQVGDVEARGAQLFDPGRDDAPRFVRRIIQHLHLLRNEFVDIRPVRLEQILD